MIVKIITLIEELAQISKVCIGAPVQKSKYEQIINELRKAYKLDKNSFSIEDIYQINKFKKKIYRTFQLEAEQKPQLFKYFQEEKYKEAKDYATAKPYVVPMDSVVFHKTEYFIGTIFDWNPVQRLYKVRIFMGDYKWYKEANLIVIGTSKKLTCNDDILRFTHCWNCKESLEPGDDQCRYCSWYECPVCGACGCS